MTVNKAASYHRHPVTLNGLWRCRCLLGESVFDCSEMRTHERTHHLAVHNHPFLYSHQICGLSFGRWKPTIIGHPVRTSCGARSVVAFGLARIYIITNGRHDFSQFSLHGAIYPFYGSSNLSMEGTMSFEVNSHFICHLNDWMVHKMCSIVRTHFGWDSSSWGDLFEQYLSHWECICFSAWKHFWPFRKHVNYD